MPEKKVKSIEIVYTNSEHEEFLNPKYLRIEDGILYFNTEDGIAIAINLTYVVKFARRGC